MLLSTIILQAAGAAIWGKVAGALGAAIAALAARCGYDEVNSIKWNDVAAKIKGIYQEVIDKNNK